MKTAIAVITMIAVGLIAVACSDRPTPGAGSQGTPVQNSTPVPSTPVPPPADSEGGTGGRTPRGDSGGMPYADYAFIKSARIVLESGASPTARLVVTTPCEPPDGPPSISDYYPWIEVGMVTQIRECTVESTEGLVEVSISLEDRAHLFEDCKTYAVVINQRRTHATAADIAGFCAPESDPAPEDILSLTNIDDVRLSHPPGSGLLLAADYILTGSCVGPESHRLERDGDGLKVYLTVPTETPARRFVPLSCRGLLGEYSIPLAGFEAGQTVSVWVNGTERSLVVPATGQVVGPNIQGAKPYRVEQLDRSELERSRALWAANAARTYSFEFTVLGDWPGRVEPDWELAKTYEVSVRDGLVVSIVDLDTGQSFPGKTSLSARLNGEFLQFGAFFDVLTTVGQSAKFDDTLGYPTEMVYRHEGFGTLSHLRVGNYQVITPTASVNRPTSPTFDVRCISTKMAPGVITAVIGKEPIPTGFDANNTGSCSFSWPVSAIRIRLWYGISNKSDNQMALIQFDEPVRDISFPLPDHVLVPIVKADLSQGPYLREVWVISLSGEATEIPGFSDVNLVTGPIPEKDRPVSVEKPLQRHR